MQFTTSPQLFFVMHRRRSGYPRQAANTRSYVGFYLRCARRRAESFRRIADRRRAVQLGGRRRRTHPFAAADFQPRARRRGSAGRRNLASSKLPLLDSHASPDGYIHIESPVRRSFTLGQFFDIWGAELSWTHAAGAVAAHGGRLSIWVNGKTWHGADPRSIVLRDQESIVIQAGPPFAKPAPSDWTKL